MEIHQDIGENEDGKYGPPDQFEPDIRGAGVWATRCFMKQFPYVFRQVERLRYRFRSILSTRVWAVDRTIFFPADLNINITGYHLCRIKLHGFDCFIINLVIIKMAYFKRKHL